MGVDEGNLQVINVDVLESCPITIIVILNLLVHSTTIQYHSYNSLIDNKCHRTIPTTLYSST